MTPLEIHCLLEIYALANPEKDGHSQHPMALTPLAQGGLIEKAPHQVPEEYQWVITDKGKAHVEHLCNLPRPEPKTIWIIPKKERPTIYELEQILAQDDGEGQAAALLEIDKC